MNKLNPEQLRNVGMTLAKAGCTKREIAAELGVSPETALDIIRIWRRTESRERKMQKEGKHDRA